MANGLRVKNIRRKALRRQGHKKKTRHEAEDRVTGHRSTPAIAGAQINADLQKASMSPSVRQEESSSNALAIDHSAGDGTGEPRQLLPPPTHSRFHHVNEVACWFPANPGADLYAANLSMIAENAARRSAASRRFKRKRSSSDASSCSSSPPSSSSSAGNSEAEEKVSSRDLTHILKTETDIDTAPRLITSRVSSKEPTFDGRIYNAVKGRTKRQLDRFLRVSSLKLTTPMIDAEARNCSVRAR